MARIAKDTRVIDARRRRNELIKRRFETLYNKGLRWEIVMATLIDEFALAESTIAQIVKSQGRYAKSIA